MLPPHLPGSTVLGSLVAYRVLYYLLPLVLAGASVSGEWQRWILFTHAQDFGIKDPKFGYWSTVAARLREAGDRRQLGDGQLFAS